MDGQDRPAADRALHRLVRRVYLLSVTATLAWLSAIFLAPYLRSRSSGAAGLLYAVFSPVCHQIPGRCFALSGYPLAVCGRCLGIYVGFLAGLAVYPVVRGFSKPTLPRVRIIGLACVPAGLDVLAGALGLWASPIGFRFATGFLCGTPLPFYFMSGVVDVFAPRATSKIPMPAGGAGPAGRDERGYP
jgi:uncharacterized membrane protein